MLIFLKVINKEIANDTAKNLFALIIICYGLNFIISKKICIITKIKLLKTNTNDFLINKKTISKHNLIYAPLNI